MHNELLLFISLALAAFLYASVGHGGASSYLALLTVFHYAPEHIRSTALILNIIISGVSFLSFRKACVFPTKLFLSLIIFSIPAAFIGGTIIIDPHLYQKILGVLLLFPVLRLFNVFPVNEKPVADRKWWMAPLLGLSIGFISGLIGIGGGIILSPFILLMGWANMKETAAISALFIFMNSIAGLLGSGINHLQVDGQMLLLVPLTVAGGITGAYLGAHHFRVPILRYLLAIVLLVAASKFLIV